MTFKGQERLGKENFNSNGTLMKVVEYNGATDIIVEFQDDYKIKVKTAWKNFQKGIVGNPYDKTVYNVGIKGIKYSVSENGKLTKEYNAWHDMLKRCYDENYHKNKPTYKECIVCDEWLLYENFYEWLHSQDNFEKWYDLKLSAVDKDIILKNNKIYSPETCCLVPLHVNSLFTKTDAHRGNLPIGVCYNKKSKSYESICVFGDNKKYKSHNTPEEAFYTYKMAKEKYIKQIAKEEYDKGNITEKCYDAMMNYVVEITD